MFTILFFLFPPIKIRENINKKYIKSVKNKKALIPTWIGK